MLRAIAMIAEVMCEVVCGESFGCSEHLQQRFQTSDSSTLTTPVTRTIDDVLLTGILHKIGFA